jgi:hypothetical protein
MRTKVTYSALSASVASLSLLCGCVVAPPPCPPLAQPPADLMQPKRDTSVKRLRAILEQGQTSDRL